MKKHKQNKKNEKGTSRRKHLVPYARREDFKDNPDAQRVWDYLVGSF